MANYLTPMMSQYRRVKSKLPDNTILFFRLGDFYEMFFDDAVEASKILDIALTKRNKVPMCGVPYHSSESYLAKLIRAGKKVAVCDQVEDASTAKGLVRREVTSIVTPGAALSDELLDASRGNYLAGIYEAGGIIGLALLDLSTGEFRAEETDDPAMALDSLARFAPAECVVPSEALVKHGPRLRSLFGRELTAMLSQHDDWTFEYEVALDTLTRHFKVQSLDCFGAEGRRALVGAAGGVLHYLKNVLLRGAEHVARMRVGSSSDFLMMDEATRINLDLVERRSCSPGRRETGERIVDTLLGVLDATQTAMGARLLREWVLSPLAKLESVRERQDSVEALCLNRALLRDARDSLGGVRDMERIIARLGAGGGNARDVRALGQSLAALPGIRGLLTDQATRQLVQIKDEIIPLPALVELIDSSIADEPPATTKDGGIIKKGFNEELDELRDAAAKGRSWLAEYQAKEQQRTGVKTLKVRHNKVFGYYIEISKAQCQNAPADYLRKQTLVNAERFITPELKEYESKIMGAQDRARALEYDLFIEIKEQALKETERVQTSARSLARLDALASLADRALALRYARPAMTEKKIIKIKDGRHPVVELIPGGDRFVPNDTLLDDASWLAIITGPNMAGKSTYIRQVALIVVMAHIGSFVPAAEAEIGIVDRLFTRVGASDDLLRGRSTFMVEMQETANILHNATDRSLVILDEIGRGTSTFDGISIAWAVAEALHNQVKAKTMFATHYHELTDLARTLNRARNFTVLVKEQGEGIVFLRKIAPGSADKSYGIHVARLAGLPREVIERAKEILLNLEEGEFGETGLPKIAARRGRKEKNDSAQMSLF